jgi:hypothetical protein
LSKFAVKVGETIEIDPGTEVVPLEIIEDKRCADETRCDSGGVMRVRLKVTELGKTEERIISPTQRFRIGGGWLFFAGTYGRYGLSTLERAPEPYLLAFTFDPKACPEPDVKIFVDGLKYPAAH